MAKLGGANSSLGKRVRESAKTTSKTVVREAEKNRRCELEKRLAALPTKGRAMRIRSVSDMDKPYLASYSLAHREKSVQFATGRLAHVARLLGQPYCRTLPNSRSTIHKEDSATGGRFLPNDQHVDRRSEPSHRATVVRFMAEGAEDGRAKGSRQSTFA